MRPPTMVISDVMTFDPVFLDSQRIGAQHHEVGEFSGLQGAALAFVERQVGAVGGGTAQRLHARQRLGRRDPLLGHVARALDRLRDRQEIRDRHVVGRERYLHAGIKQAAQRHDLVVALRRQPLGVDVQPFVEIVVGVGGEHQPHAHDAFDVLG